LSRDVTQLGQERLVIIEHHVNHGVDFLTGECGGDRENRRLNCVQFPLTVADHQFNVFPCDTPLLAQPLCQAAGEFGVWLSPKALLFVT
jgi:hypothetical protein